MQENKCQLQLIDLYFSKFSFSQVRQAAGKEYESSFHITYEMSKEDNSKVKVSVDTSTSDVNHKVFVELQTVGIFKIEKSGLSKATQEKLIKANTVAIMFPYIRSQISLITTQPGITPVMIPPMNINGLIDTNTSHASKEN